MASKETNPYYDSVRDKQDRSEFGSLRMGMTEKRRPPAASGGVWRVVVWVAVLIVAAVLAKRYLLPLIAS